METNFSFLLYSILIWLTRVIDCEVYPSVQWNPLNPMFKTDFTLFVFPTSKMNLVCPNDATVLQRLRDNTPKEQLFENLWFVDQASYDTCTVNIKTSRQLLKCSDPFRLMYFPVVFQQYSPTDRGLEFKPGKDYYFISTSDGTVGSLNNTSGGHCKTHNMKLKVHICKNKDTRCVATSSSTPLKTVPTTSPVVRTFLPIIVSEQQEGNAHAHRNENSTEKKNTTSTLTTPANRTSTEIDDRHREVIDKLKYLLAIGFLLAVILTLLFIILILFRKKIFNFKKFDKVRASTDNVKWRTRNSTSSTREILGVRFSGVSQADVSGSMNGDCEL